MAQFQVYRVPGGRLVLDLQTDLIDTGSRVVAPLVPTSSGPSRLLKKSLSRNVFLLSGPVGLMGHACRGVHGSVLRPSFHSRPQQPW